MGSNGQWSELQFSSHRRSRKLIPANLASGNSKSVTLFLTQHSNASDLQAEGKASPENHESSSVYTLVLKRFVEPLAETAGQRNDLLIVGDQQRQIAKSIVDSHAVSTSSQVLFNHDSPLRGKLPVEVGREFKNDLPTADFHEHASQFTLPTAIRSSRQRYKNNVIRCSSGDLGR